jgi:outer membrane protein assembly factor BamA
MTPATSAWAADVVAPPTDATRDSAPASPYAFVPVVLPITEPAVGYGAGGGLVFIDSREPQAGAGSQAQSPNLAAVGGFATQNGSWGALGGYSRWWLNQRLQTQVGLGYASINLDYYGLGDNSVLRTNPLHYTLQPLGGVVGVGYRIADTPLMAGLRYIFAKVDAAFERGILPPEITPRELESRVGGLTPALSYDTRNNIFTPTKGLYANVSVGVFREAFGGDFNFETVGVTTIAYIPLHPTLIFGAKVDGSFSFGDVPFYLRPYIALRGTPAKRYEGEHIAQLEVEARWQFWKRLSLVGFSGGGIAWNHFARFAQTRTVVTGGMGFRYELVRKYGLHMGVDVAFGPTDPVLYVQFGSAWFRP